MAMDAGTVNGEGSGSGLALALFDSESPAISGDAALDAATKAALLAGLAARSTARAAVIVGHIVSNAEVTTSIANTDAGLQSTTTAGAPTGPHIIPTPIVLATKGSIA